MKNSFRVILSLAGLALAAAPQMQAESTTPPADKPEHRRGGPGGMMDRAAKELGLSADQEAKWKEIGTQEKAAMEAIRADGTLSQDDRRAKGMETMKTFGDQRRAVLNADQQKKFDDLRAKMRERGLRGDKGPGGPGEKPPGN